MDSMVNRYTSDRKIRSDDAYTPGAEPGKRPDRAVLVYAQRAREAFADVPVVIGGIEASLRRIAHYDYWSDKVRRSILPDSKADLLLFGNAERALVELTHRLAKGEKIADIHDLRGTAFMAPPGWTPAPDWTGSRRWRHGDARQGRRADQDRGAPARLRGGAEERGDVRPGLARLPPRVEPRQRPRAGADAWRARRLAQPAADPAVHRRDGRHLRPALRPRAASEPTARRRFRRGR